MKKLRMLLPFICSLLFLSGCTQLGIPDPFAPKDVNEVYYGQFQDIPLPVDLTLDSKRTLVTTGADNNKIGLETYEGRIDIASLSNAMIHNMAKHNWSLRGSASGYRLMQVYEKGQQVVVLYFYDQTFTTAMEVWVLNRLADSTFGSSSLPSTYTPMPSYDTIDQWSSPDSIPLYQ